MHTTDQLCVMCQAPKLTGKEIFVFLALPLSRCISPRGLITTAWKTCSANVSCYGLRQDKNRTNDLPTPHPTHHTQRTCTCQPLQAQRTYTHTYIQLLLRKFQLQSNKCRSNGWRMMSGRKHSSWVNFKLCSFTI